MKTVVYKKFGPPEVLQLQNQPKPVPGDHDVLIKIHATTVTAGDVRMRSFTVPPMEWLPAHLFLGFKTPRRPVLGMELAGEIEATGRAVTRFKKGDQVIASTFGSNFGGYAEYKCMPENGLLALKPASLSYEEAATLPIGGATALRFLIAARLKPGQSILVYGASGSVGSFAVQIASLMGAKVTAVCSAANTSWVKSLGSDVVFDYASDAWKQNRQTFDVVFDAVGKLSASQARQRLARRGVYLSALGNSGKRNAEDLILLSQRVDEGKIKPVLDRCYPLEQIVEAHRYVEAGHKKGNVIITIPIK